VLKADYEATVLIGMAKISRAIFLKIGYLVPLVLKADSEATVLIGCGGAAW
jgi:hypothetical protein